MYYLVSTQRRRGGGLRIRTSNCHFEYYTRQEGKKNIMKMNLYGLFWD